MRCTPLVLALLFGCGSSSAPEVVTMPRTPLHPDSPAEAVDLDPSPTVLRVALRAAPATVTIDGHAEDGYAFAGQVPGPTLRARVGDRLVAVLENALDAPTTIHWHGAHVPYAMDGVTWMQDGVAPGATFTYDFVLDRAGTYWYHPHFDAGGQVDKGMYGVLIVEDPAEPAPDEELVLVFDVFGEQQEEAEGATAGHGHSHGLQATPPRWLVNGKHAPELRITGGHTVRVRMLNASNLGYLDLRWPDIRLIASEQGLLPAAQSPDRLLLAPGDRADVEWSVGEGGFVVQAAPYSLLGGAAYGEPEEVLRVEVDAPAPAPAPLAWPFPGGAPTADPTWTDIVYTFSGSSEGGQWLMNGEAYPDVTVEELALGAEAVIEIRNISPTHHPFHLHGVPFEVLSIDGVPPAWRTIEDTVDVGLYQSVRLLVTADNPGDWMAHCHILPHAHDGMMTVLRIK